MLAGKCPVCQNFVTHATGYALDINVGIGRTFKGVSFHCPNAMCNTVLGVQIDPLAVKNDTVSEVKKVVEQLLVLHS